MLAFLIGLFIGGLCGFLLGAVLSINKTDEEFWEGSE